MPETRRARINLASTLCVNSVDEEVHAFDEPEVPHLQNTGIERGGGLTNIYEVERAHTAGAGSYFVTRKNKVLSTHAIAGVLRDVKINDRTIGQISQYGVEARRVLSGYDDAFVSSQAGYVIAAKLIGQVVTVANISIATGVVVASRSTTFTILSGLSAYTSFSIVRKATQEYADNLEFVLRIGDRGILLKEASPTYAYAKWSNITSYFITAICTYGTAVVFGTYDGKIFSVDANGNYRYPDGSGSGTGPCNNGDALGSGYQVTAMVASGSILYVAGKPSGDLGRVCSFDGSSWRNYDGTGSGTGPYSSTILGTSTAAIYAVAVYGNYIIFAGSAGRLGSWDTVTLAWKDYAGTGTGGGPYNNGTVIGAVTIYALAASGSILVVAGTSGRLGNWNGSAWTTYTGGGAAAQPYNNGTVIGAQDIRTLLYFGTILVVAGGLGRLGNYAAGAWTNYNGTGAGVQPYNDTTAMGGTLTIYSLVTNGTTMLVVGQLDVSYRWTSRLASWDGSNWKNYDGTGSGTGLYKASLKAFDFGPCRYMAVQSGKVFFTGWGSAIFVHNVTAAAWETVYSALTVPSTHFGSVSTFFRSWVYRDYLTGIPKYYIVAYGAQLSSFDGIAWKYWDGTGSGTGPYASASVLGASDIYALGQYNQHLIVAGGSGRLASWDGTNWKNYDGTGIGTGPYDNGTVIGANIIYALCVIGTKLAVAGVGGRLGNWNGAAWTTYTGGGAAVQPWSNATVLGAVDINTMCTFLTFLIVGGVSGRLGSWDLTNWKNYDGTGTGTGPYNNNTVTAGIINIVMQWRKFLIVAGATGRLGSWDGSNWKNYDASGTGTGPYNNQTAITQIINALGALSGYLYIGSIYQAVASWDGTAWRNSDGTGAGTAGYHYSNDSFGNFLACTFCHWNGGLFLAGMEVFFITDKTCTDRIQAGGAQQFRIPEKRLSQLFVWKFENNAYLFGLVGNAESIFYIFTSGDDIIPLLARYVVVQTYSSKTRMILYGTPAWYETRLDAVGLVGYTDFFTFTAIVQYSLFGDTIDTAPHALVGPGSLDMTYTKVGVSTASYSVYSPAFVAAETALLTLAQTGTDTPVGAYGKLTNALGLTAAVEFRILWIDESATTLSVAVVDGLEDTLGVLLSAVGECDDNYAPHISGTTILYQSLGRLTIVKLGTSPTPAMQRITDRLYKLNTIHPLNVYDDETESLQIGSPDFNGRVVFASTATPAGTAKKFASVLSALNSVGIDVGDKLVYLTTLTTAEYRIIGHRIPAVSSVLPFYGIDVFVEDLYYSTTLNDGSEFIVPAKVDTLYVTSLELAIPMGWTYGDQVAIGDTSSVFLFLVGLLEHDTYLIGNQVAGQHYSFMLFGQRYLFDGTTIWLAVFDGTTFDHLERMASAGGMTFLCASPTAAFFLSDFDNSLYTFDGGRSLSKFYRYNKEPAIIRALWSVLYNALLLECSDRFLWVRDALISRNLKKANQTSLGLTDTVDGPVAFNDSYTWRYPYVTEAGATVVPLTWQSAYFGVPGNQKSVFSEWVLTLFDTTKGKVTLILTCYAFDTENWTSEVRTLTINPADWAGVGFIRIRVRPPIAKCLASSVQMYSADRILIQDAVAEISEEAKGLVPASRST